MLIFWPLDERGHGFVFGWVEYHICVIAGTLPFTTHASALLALSSWKSSPAVNSVREKLQILGTSSQRVASNTCCIPDISWQSDIGPKSQLTYTFYHRPNSTFMRFYSLSPIDLDVTEAKESSNKSDSGGLLQMTFQRQQQLGKSDHPTMLIGGISVSTINQMNSAYSLLKFLTENASPCPPSSCSLTCRNLSTIPSALVHRLFVMLVKPFVHNLTRFCQLSIPPFLAPQTQLKHVINGVQQIDLRLEQIFCLVQQYYTLRRRDGTNPHVSAQYISFSNCIWLILNDIIIGTAFGTFMCENHEFIASLLHRHCKLFTIQTMRTLLIWLDNWPAGLKLNTELSNFYCFMFIRLGSAWEVVLDLFLPYLPTVIRVIGAMGPLGMTMILSSLSDLLSLMTAYLYVSYLIVTAIYKHQLNMAASLSNLFQGKRRNVLRNRTDSWDYDVDQLLLGTILFTLVAFLFPTILIYYSLFGLTRLAIIMLHANLETALAFMNHFPLFAIIIRIKDPWRLPGGIFFRHYSVNPLEPSVLVLKNSPVPFSKIFFQFRTLLFASTRLRLLTKTSQVLLWSRLSAHYNPLRLLHCLASGTYLTPIPRYSIRYTIRPILTDPKPK